MNTEIKQFLEKNPDYIIELARDVNCHNCSFPEFDYYSFDELVNCWNPDDFKSFCLLFADAIKDKTFDDKSSVFVFDDFGDLNMTTIEELREEALDNMDEVMSHVFDLYPHYIYIYDEEFEKLIKKVVNEMEVK